MRSIIKIMFFLALLLFQAPIHAFSQFYFFEVKPSKYYEMLSIKTGINFAFANSADDQYQLSIRIPLFSRYHITLGGGYRDVQPKTAGIIATLETDLYRTEKHRIKLDLRHSYVYRKGHRLFDDRFHKTSIGFGAESIVWARFGLGVECAPIGIYYGTRHDNPEKGTPSAWGAREVRTNVFIVL